MRTIYLLTGKKLTTKKGWTNLITQLILVSGVLQIDCQSKIGFNVKKETKLWLILIDNYNRIARTRPQVERYKRGWNLVTNARKRGSSPQSLGRSPRALPVWERLERSDKDTGVVERFGAYGGLKNRLGKAEHCIIPPYQEKHKADRIFPNQITREETINEMFGTVKKPPRYKQGPRGGGLLSKTGGAARKSPRLGRKSIVRATI